MKKNRSSDGSKILQRLENFTQYCAALDFLLNGSKLLGVCGQLFGETAVLYKEKINYKLPGGDDFNLIKMLLLVGGCMVNHFISLP